MKSLAVFILAALIAHVALAERRPSPPTQRGIRSTPMHKQQGEPSDTGRAPRSYNEQASAFRK